MLLYCLSSLTMGHMKHIVGSVFQPDGQFCPQHPFSLLALWGLLSNTLLGPPGILQWIWERVLCFLGAHHADEIIILSLATQVVLITISTSNVMLTTLWSLIWRNLMLWTLHSRTQITNSDLPGAKVEAYLYLSTKPCLCGACLGARVASIGLCDYIPIQSSR